MNEKRETIALRAPYAEIDDEVDDVWLNV